MRVLTESNEVMEVAEIRYEEIEANYTVKIRVKPSSCRGKEIEYVVLLENKNDSLSVVTKLLDNALSSGFVDLTRFPIGRIAKPM